MKYFLVSKTMAYPIRSVYSMAPSVPSVSAAVGG